MFTVLEVVARAPEPELSVKGGNDNGTYPGECALIGRLTPVVHCHRRRCMCTVYPNNSSFSNVSRFCARSPAGYTFLSALERRKSSRAMINGFFFLERGCGTALLLLLPITRSSDIFETISSNSSGATYNCENIRILLTSSAYVMRESFILNRGQNWSNTKRKWIIYSHF